MPVTAHVTCYRKDTVTDPDGDGRSEVGLEVDRGDQRNQAWATADWPSLIMSMTVSPDAAGQFDVGQPYTLTIAEAAQ